VQAFQPLGAGRGWPPPASPESRARRMAAVLSIAAGATVGTIYLKRARRPELDRAVSARALCGEIFRAVRMKSASTRSERNWRYGLNYYSAQTLPECSGEARPWWGTPVSRQAAVSPRALPAPISPV